MDFIRLFTIALLGCIALVGCDTEPTKPNNPADTNGSQTDIVVQNKVSAEYICGHLLIKTDLSGNNLTLSIEDKSYQLSRSSDPSGNKFANTPNNIVFSRKGDSAALEFNGQQYSNCQKVIVQRADSSMATLKLPFTARGNEPGWLLTLSKEQLELISDHGHLTITAPIPSSPSIEPDKPIRFETERLGTLTFLSETNLCHDSMSGMPYPYTVSMQTAQQNFNGCGGEPRSLLTKNKWSVLTIADNMLSEESRVSLNFNPEMRLTGVASCNRYTTSYILTGEGLSISPIATTQMACEPFLMEQEASFLKHLVNVTRFDINPSGQLVLYTNQDATIVAQPTNR
ncbi:MAG: META domain-containing protein [Kangiella sp.]|jgi:heat shock protein HslJ|nr:META domain-containing protein [Kangiella sp.]MCW9027359.1 META domain-containing protein [Kangiella sp.]